MGSTGSSVEMGDSGVQLSSMGSVDLSSGSMITVASVDVSASATDFAVASETTRVHGADVVLEAGFDLDAKADILHALAGSSMTVFSGENFAASSESMSFTASSTATLESSDSVSAVAAEMNLATNAFDAFVGDAAIHVEKQSSVYAGESMTLSSESVDVSASVLSMFSSESASVSS
eukprot:COSAG06_NODE_30037_length_545_cov_879.426009_1_plen_176_part_10